MGHVCCVVDGDCDAPANCPSESTIPKCFSCGEDVCWPCSMRIPYATYGVRRICRNCVRDRDRITGEKICTEHAKFMERHPSKQEMRDWRPKIYIQRDYTLEERRARPLRRRRVA